MFDIGDIERRHSDARPGAVIVKRVAMKTTTWNAKERLVQGICSAETVDLDGDVVLMDGVDTSYFMGENPLEAEDETGVRTVYFDHDYDRPIGRCLKMVRKGDGLYVQTYITRLPIGDEVLTLWEEGIMRGLSIGFRSMESSEPTMEEMVKHGSGCNRVIRKSLLLEYSFTPMPCNPDAMNALDSLVAKSRIRKRTADLIRPQIVTPQPQTFVTSGRVFSIH